MKQSTLILILSCLAYTGFGQLYQCDFINSPGKQLIGCSQYCRDFADLSEAQEVCRQDTSCGGVTWSRPNFGGSNSYGPYDGWGWQLRASYQPVESSYQEYSFVKQTSCNPQLVTQNPKCSFNWGPVRALNGCFQDCKDFADSNQAAQACIVEPNCGGITWSRPVLGGRASLGPVYGWGWQLRSSNIFQYSSYQESSWQKPSNCNVQALPPNPPLSIDVTNSFCQFTKQSSRTYTVQLNFPSFTNERDALQSCSFVKECVGLKFNGVNWNLASGIITQADSSQTVQTKGNCNLPNYGVLFTGCYFTGDILEFKGIVSKIDFSLYHSLYLPPYNWIDLYNQENLQGQATRYDASVLCLEQSFKKFFVQKISYETGSKETTVAKKIKKNSSERRN